jgi:hypothetical protein
MLDAANITGIFAVPLGKATLLKYNGKLRNNNNNSNNNNNNNNSNLITSWLSPRANYPLLLRKSGSAGNKIQTSGSVARNSDH